MHYDLFIDRTLPNFRLFSVFSNVNTILQQINAFLTRLSPHNYLTGGHLADHTSPATLLQTSMQIAGLTSPF